MPANDPRPGLTASFTMGRPARAPRRTDDDAPFPVLVLGDFSGRASRGLRRPVREAPVRRIDADNFDDEFRRLGAGVRVMFASGVGIEFSVRTLDDLHPDHLFDSLPHFADLRDLRTQLGNPATFASAAARLGLGTPAAATTTAPAATTAAPASPPADDLFARLLGRPQSAASTSAPAPAPTGLDALLGRVVAPDVVAAPDARKGQLVAEVDRRIADSMRAILHAPAVRSLEASWRGLDRLVRTLDPDRELPVHFLDVTADELTDDLASTDLAGTALFAHVVERAVAPWALVVSLHDFAADTAAIGLLGRLSAIAEQAGCAAVAGLPLGASDGAVFTGSEEKTAWNALRALPSAAHLCVCAPRVMVRLPYGTRTDPIERFAYEEQLAVPEADAYVWGSSAIACAELLAQSFRTNAWESEPGDELEVGDLPVHAYTLDGEKVASPSTQVALGPQGTDALLALGMSPLVAIRGRDAARFARIQSVASPARALRGKWR